MSTSSGEIIYSEGPNTVNTELASPSRVEDDIFDDVDSDGSVIDPVLQSTESNIDSTIEQTAALEAYLELLEGAGDKGINKQAAAMISVSVRHIRKQFDMTPSVSLEEFKTARPYDRKVQVVISNEDIKEAIKAGGKKLLELFKSLLARANELWKNFNRPATKAKAKTEYLLEAAKVFPPYPGGKMKGPIPQPPPNVKTIIVKPVEEKKEEPEEKEEPSEENPTVALVSPEFNTINGKPHYVFVDIEKHYAELLQDTHPRDVLRGLTIIDKELSLAVANKSFDGTILKIKNELSTIFDKYISWETRKLGGGWFLSMDEETFRLTFKTNNTKDIPTDLTVEVRPLIKLVNNLKNINAVWDILNNTEIPLGKERINLFNKIASSLEKLEDVFSDEKEEIKSLVDGIQSLNTCIKIQEHVGKCLVSKMRQAELELNAYND